MFILYVEKILEVFAKVRTRLGKKLVKKMSNLGGIYTISQNYMLISHLN